MNWIHPKQIGPTKNRFGPIKGKGIRKLSKKYVSDPRALLSLQGGNELKYKYSKHLPANRSPLTGLPCNGLPTTSVSSSTSSRNP